MITNIVFEANKFLNSVSDVKTFWLSSKLNKLRIEAHSDARRVDFISVNRETGLETVVTIPAYVSKDITLYIKTVNSFYKAVKTLQEMNVGKNNSLNLRLVPSQQYNGHFSLETSLTHLNIVVSTNKL